MVQNTALLVIKKDGRREFFDRAKLRKGIIRAVEKRPVSIEKVDEIVDQVERECLRKESEEVDSEIVGKAVMRRLKRIDKVAWLRFASVYLNFEDLEDFKEAIEKLSK